MLTRLLGHPHCSCCTVVVRIHSIHTWRTHTWLSAHSRLKTLSATKPNEHDYSYTPTSLKNCVCMPIWMQQAVEIAVVVREEPHTHECIRRVSARVGVTYDGFKDCIITLFGSSPKCYVSKMIAKEGFVRMWNIRKQKRKSANWWQRFVVVLHCVFCRLLCLVRDYACFFPP